MGTVRYTVVNGVVRSENRSGVERAYSLDPLGNTRALYDTTTTRTDTFEYFPSGTVSARTRTTPTPFQWVGGSGYYRDNSKRTHVRARNFYVNLGRWAETDPICFEGGDYNLYQYVKNRFVVVTDPSGLVSIAPTYCLPVSIRLIKNRPLIAGNCCTVTKKNEVDFTRCQADTEIQTDWMCINHFNIPTDIALIKQNKWNIYQMYSLNAFTAQNLGEEPFKFAEPITTWDAYPGANKFKSCPARPYCNNLGFGPYSCRGHFAQSFVPPIPYFGLSWVTWTLVDKLGLGQLPPQPRKAKWQIVFDATFTTFTAQMTSDTPVSPNPPVAGTDSDVIEWGVRIVVDNFGDAPKCTTPTTPMI